MAHCHSSLGCDSVQLRFAVHILWANHPSSNTERNFGVNVTNDAGTDRGEPYIQSLLRRIHRKVSSNLPFWRHTYLLIYARS